MCGGAHRLIDTADRRRRFFFFLLACRNAGCPHNPPTPMYACGCGLCRWPHRRAARRKIYRPDLHNPMHPQNTPVKRRCCARRRRVGAGARHGHPVPCQLGGRAGRGGQGGRGGARCGSFVFLSLFRAGRGRPPPLPPARPHSLSPPATPPRPSCLLLSSRRCAAGLRARRPRRRPGLRRRRRPGRLLPAAGRRAVARGRDGASSSSSSSRHGRRAGTPGRPGRRTRRRHPHRPGRGHALLLRLQFRGPAPEPGTVAGPVHGDEV